MRNAFFNTLHKEMSTNPDIYFITADLGFGLADRIKQDFPERFYNAQAAEQAMLGIGIGLALQGRIPICYSITPFLLHRPYEAIKLYLEGERIPVKLCGSGRGKDYKMDRESHWIDDGRVKQDLQIPLWYPENPQEIELNLHLWLKDGMPGFLSLKR